MKNNLCIQENALNSNFRDKTMQISRNQEGSYSLYLEVETLSRGNFMEIRETEVF